jgi:hypothetical protein
MATIWANPDLWYSVGILAIVVGAAIVFYATL